MNFDKLVQAKRKIKERTEISDMQIQRIIEAGWWVGTCFNLQPWKCIVKQESHSEFWDNFSRIIAILLKSNPMLATMGVKADDYRRHRDKATVTLVLCADETKLEPWFSGPPFIADGVKSNFFKDVGAILQNMKLATLNEGLAYCQVNMDLSFKGLDEALQGYLGLPKGFRVVGILALGQAEPYELKRNIPLATFIYKEGWKRRMRRECPKARDCGRFEFESALNCSLCKTFLTDNFFYHRERQILLCNVHFQEWISKGQNPDYFRQIRSKAPLKHFCTFWIDCDDHVLFRSLECTRCQSPISSYYYYVDANKKLCLNCTKTALSNGLLAPGSNDQQIRIL